VLSLAKSVDRQLHQPRTDPQGDIHMAGRVAWTHVQPARPLGPGRWMLTYTVSGRAQFRLPPTTEFLAEAGDLVLVRRDSLATRGVRPGDRWHALWLRFDPWQHWTPAGFERVADGIYRRHLTFAGSRQAVQDTWEQIITGLTYRDTSRALASVVDAHRVTRQKEERIHSQLVLLRLREIFLFAEQDPLRSARLDPRIRAALQTVSASATVPHSVAALAREVGLSSDRFARLFKSQVGGTPKRMLRTIRLRQAALQLQSTEDPVGVIAERIGFSSIFDLSRQFRREYGVSPSAYRSRYR
jgi:AraC-like DNA-binding protein